MLEVDSTRSVKKTRKKHERSQSASVPVKDVSTKVIEELPGNEKIKLRKSLQESQNKLAALQLDADLSQRQPSDNVEKTRKKKRRKRTQSADQLNHDAVTDITKDLTVEEANLVQANLYTNDKNKSLEKETKQSYSEALSGWQHSVESNEEHLQKPKKNESERRDRRVKNKMNAPDTEVQTAIGTAVSVDKVRRRMKKPAKDTPLEAGEGDATDGVKRTRRTQRQRTETSGDTVAQENLGFDDEGERDGNEVERKAIKSFKKKKSHTTEDHGYGEEQSGDGTEEPKTEAKKSSKRRRKRLKETSADLIHRALEKKRQDDGYVMCVVIHRADRLKTDLRINHPLVRVHVLDIGTGQYIKKCSRNRAATSYYENQEMVDHILPLMTAPFDFKQRKSLVPTWEDVLIINEIYSYFLQRNEEDPKVIIFFEILDFLSMTAIQKLKNTQKSDRGWYQIAWAFLKLVGTNGSPNTDTKIRLQLFHPVKSYRRNPVAAPEVYQWWLSSSRVPYPSTLYVTVKGVKPPQHVDAAGRSMFAVQEEKGKMTFEELTKKIARGGVSPRDSEGDEDGVVWQKLPGQPNRLPNQIMATLQAGRRGCFVVKFSNDGRKLACGCADKDNFSIFVFETLSTRCCSKFQGHFSIIYDLCWSHDDKELLSASSDGTARSWDAATDGTPAVKLYPHPCFVYAARYHPRRKGLVITGGYDRLVRIWSKDCDGINGQLLREMDGHGGFINTICFDASGQFMFSGDSSGTIVMWNTFENMETKSKKRRNSTTGDVQKWVISKTVKDPEIKDCIISSVSLHPNGRKLLIHTRDSVTRMLDLRSFTVMSRYIGSNNFKEHIRSTLSTCGSFVMCGSEDGVVHVWDTETGDLLKVYSDLGYTAAVSDVDFHPHDNIVAFCSFGENHPVVLYHFKQSGVQDQSLFTPVSPPTSPIPLTSRSLGQTTEEMMTHDSRNMERTTMADVASETLLLSKIKKKLDSVLEASSGSAVLRTNLATSRTYSPDQGTRGYHGLPSDTSQRGMLSLSTWGSDFGALPTTSFDDTSPFSPGDRTLTPQAGQPTVSKRNSRNVGHLNELLTVKAIYPFEARSADELTLDIGDVITVLRREDENWWVGEMANGKHGFFPTSYTVPNEETSKERTKSEKQKKHKEGKQYMAVRTADGEVKVLSAPEDSDGDMLITQRSRRTDGRPPRHHHRSRENVTRSSSPAKKSSPRREHEDSVA